MVEEWKCVENMSTGMKCDYNMEKKKRANTENIYADELIVVN